MMLNKWVLRLSIPLIVWFAIYYQSLGNMINVWNNSNTYEHCYLIIPICVWLLWQKKEYLAAIPLSAAKLPAVLLIFPCILWVVGQAASIAFFEHLAAVVSLQLIIWALIGHQQAKNNRFIICYLIFLVPFGEELIPFLQQITADISIVLLRLFGVPVFREGLYISVPRGQFEVAEACSGIRFLIASLALGTLFAHVFFQKHGKFRLFIVFSFVFPIIANGLRVFGIIMIGNFIDMKYASGIDHLVYGWFFFSLVTICSFFIAYWLRDNIITTNNNTIHMEQKSNTAVSLSGVNSIIVAIAIVSFSWSYLISQPLPDTAERPPIPLPDHYQPITDSNWTIHFPQANQTLLARAKDGNSEYYVAQYFQHSSDAEIISSRNKFYSEDNWTLSHKRTIQLNDHQANEIQLVNHRGTYFTIIYWYRVNNRYEINPIKIKLLELYYRLSRQPIVSQLTAFSSTNLDSNSLIQAISQLSSPQHLASQQ